MTNAQPMSHPGFPPATAEVSDDDDDQAKPTKPGSPERIKALLHLAHHAAGETIPAMAQILGLEEPVTRRLLNKLCDDLRLQRDRSGYRLVYFNPLARAKLRQAAPRGQA